MDFDKYSAPSKPTEVPKKKMMKNTGPSKEYTDAMNKQAGVYTCNRKVLNKENTFDTLFNHDGTNTKDGFDIGNKKHYYDSHQKSCKTTINKLMAYDNTPNGYDVLSGKPNENNFDTIKKETGEKKENHSKPRSDMNEFFYNK